MFRIPLLALQHFMVVAVVEEKEVLLVQLELVAPAVVAVVEKLQTAQLRLRILAAAVVERAANLEVERAVLVL